MTKAKTRAGKLRMKRSVGRPRIEEGEREGNGRLSRAINPKPTPDPADKFTVQMRARKLGLTLIEAKDPDAGTYIGRLYMQHRAWEQRGSAESRRPLDSITYRQYEAAQKYLALHNDHLKAWGAPGAHYERVLRSSSDEEAAAKWAAKVKEKHTEAQKAIHQAQAENRTENLWAALDYAILRDEEHPHMIGALRILCNALAHHWKIS